MPTFAVTAPSGDAESLNGAIAAVVSTASPAACEANQSLTDDEFDVDDGDLVCVHTSARLVSVVFIQDVGLFGGEVSFTTYHPSLI